MKEQKFHKGKQYKPETHSFHALWENETVRGFYDSLVTKWSKNEPEENKEMVQQHAKTVRE